MVPFAPGGTSDILARAIGPHITTAWGQPVIVENRTGANGNVGADFVAKSAPDGYTMLLSDVGALVHRPERLPRTALRPGQGFLADRDGAVFAARAGGPPLGSPVNSVKELIAYAKANPGKIELRQLGHRRRAASRGRRIRATHRRAVDVHSLQGQLPGGHGRDRGKRQRPVQRHARYLSVGEGRAPEGACRFRRDARPVRTRVADDRRVLPAS